MLCLPLWTIRPDLNSFNYWFLFSDFAFCSKPNFVHSSLTIIQRTHISIPCSMISFCCFWLSNCSGLSIMGAVCACRFVVEFEWVELSDPWLPELVIVPWPLSVSAWSPPTAFSWPVESNQREFIFISFQFKVSVPLVFIGFGGTSADRQRQSQWTATPG